MTDAGDVKFDQGIASKTTKDVPMIIHTRNLLRGCYTGCFQWPAAWLASLARPTGPATAALGGKMKRIINRLILWSITPLTNLQ